MRTKSVLVSEDDFKEMSPIVGNFDYDFLLPFVSQAQDIDISQLMGEALLKRINDGVIADDLNADETTLLEDYIQPSLVAFTMFRSMNFLSIKPDNSGLVRRNSENGQAIDMNESSFLADSQKTVAESYGKRLVEYLDANADKFPAYKEEILGQIKPTDTPSYTGGLWLGNKKDC